MATLSTDPADLFTELYDNLDGRIAGPLQPDVALAWLTDETSEDVSAWVEGIAMLGELSATAIRESIEQVDDPDEPEDAQRRIFAVLRGLDRALAHVNPHTATYDHGALRHLGVRYAHRGRLNSDATPGALVPRFAFPGREGPVAESLRELFTSVVRISAPDWDRSAHVVIPNRSDFGRRDRLQGIRVGCSPALASLDDLEIEAAEKGGRWFFDARPRTEQVAPRFGEILRRLDEAGAAIGVLPELALTSELLGKWQTVIAENPRGRASRLKWLFLGSGASDSCDPPANRGVLVDRRSGEILLEQDKLFPFALTSQQIADWGLEGLLGEGPCAERITRGEKLTVAECGLGRLAVFICEDLARITEIGGVVLAQGVSFALAPVFSAEVLEHFWEHAHAKDYANQVGTQVVVANSLVVPRAAGASGPTGTALAHAPTGWARGETENATDVCVFTLSVEAAVPAVVL